MAKAKPFKNIEGLSFIAGIALAIIIGIVSVNAIVPMTTWLWILAIIGLIVGILNLTTKETVLFLIVALSIVITAWFTAGPLSTLAVIGIYLKTILADVTMVVGVATLVVALRTAYALAFK